MRLWMAMIERQNASEEEERYRFGFVLAQGPRRASHKVRASLNIAPDERVTLRLVRIGGKPVTAGRSGSVVMALEDVNEMVRYTRIISDLPRLIAAGALPGEADRRRALALARRMETRIKRAKFDRNHNIRFDRTEPTERS